MSSGREGQETLGHHRAVKVWLFSKARHRMGNTGAASKSHLLPGCCGDARQHWVAGLSCF
jgi:hypothetical protein